MARYYLETYGCTSNQGESHRIEAHLRDAGHYRVESPQPADVAILNTCTVIEPTEDRMLRRAKQLQENIADVIITGCMALAQGERFPEAGIDARVCHWDEVPAAVGNGECPTTTPDIEPLLDGVIGILPIARGCMSDCSYCITKHATGRIDSPSVEENVERARALIHTGAKELRITGQDTGVYGWDTGERQLHTLLERICDIDGDFRVRVGMANPKGIHGIRDELADVFARNDKLYNFLHIPVQSGSNTVLGEMRRQHQVGEFLDVVETFSDALEEWTLATDFIAGFPTESDADHEASVELLKATRPTKINVTRFSKRPGTDAAALKGLGGPTKKERSRELSRIKRDIVAEHYAELVGSTRSVLVVEEGTGDSVKCRDDAYHQLIIRNGREHSIMLGDRLSVQVTASEPMYAFAEPSDSIDSDR